MIGVLSLGIGNVSSVRAAFQRINLKTKEVKTVNDLLRVSHLVLPGVGSMKELMDRINSASLAKPLRQYSEVGYMLGICLGFQSLFDYSHEGNCDCLGLLVGEVLPLASNYHLSANIGYRIVNSMENNKLNVIPEKRSSDSRISAKSGQPRFYFTHSYFVNLTDSTSHTTTIGDSIVPITAAAGNGVNVFGTQFHPELSHTIGKDLLINFASL